MPISRWYTVSTDTTDKTIYDGPLLADSTRYSPPSGRQMITEAAAATGGYTLPPRSLADINTDQLHSNAAAALAVNDTYLAVTNPLPTQVAAQVRALTRQNNALIRLMVAALGDISDT